MSSTICIQQVAMGPMFVGSTFLLKGKSGSEESVCFLYFLQFLFVSFLKSVRNRKNLLSCHWAQQIWSP